MTGTPHELVRDVFTAGIRAVDARAALRRELARFAPEGRVHVLAGGKAAVPMMAEALARLQACGARAGQALIVAPHGTGAVPTGADLVEGDHPKPGTGSGRSADRIGRFAKAVGNDDCWVLLSGGFSSLAAAPIADVSLRGLRDLFAGLLASGLPIREMNAVRKRFLRWGAGRLAADLSDATLHVFAVSDVPGDFEPDIGSGPCSPDPHHLEDVLRLVESAALRHRIPEDVARSLATQRAAGRETLKPGDPLFNRVTFSVIARNADAVVAAAARAMFLRAGSVHRLALDGDAAAAGTALGRQLAASPPGTWLIAGGETTVMLGATNERGGRCQELALAAARELAGLDRVALLAAGTDGRDGTTDAAGAVVDGATWEAVRFHGSDPATALSRHGAHRALDRAGALLRIGPTGTNVMDLVVGLRG